MRTGLWKKLLSLGLCQGVAQVWRPWRTPSFLKYKSGTWSQTPCSLWLYRMCTETISSNWSCSKGQVGIFPWKVFPKTLSCPDPISSSPVLLLHTSCIASGFCSFPIPWRKPQPQPAFWLHVAPLVPACFLSPHSPGGWLVLFLGLLKCWRPMKSFSVKSRGISCVSLLCRLVSLLGIWSRATQVN